MQATLTVHATCGDLDKTEEIIVELLSNAAGRLILKNDSPRVLVTDLCGLESKIEETELSMYPNHLAAGATLDGEVTPKGKRSKAPCSIKTVDRPLHRELREACIAIDERVRAIRQRMWKSHDAEVEARNLAQVPAGMIALRFAGSEADGWIENYRDSEGRFLRNPKIAGRVGAIGWITPEDYAEATGTAERDREAEIAEQAAQAARKIEDEAGLLATEVPADAVAAYKRFGGDDEAAWEAEDEAAWALIRRYAPAIEARGLAMPGPGLVKKLLRSQESPIHEGA